MMCSLKITLKHSDGGVQTFSRTTDAGGGDRGSTSDLIALRKSMGDIQAEVNAALTVLVDKEKAAQAASGKVQSKKEIDDQEDEEDDEDEDDNNDASNGCSEPPEKLRKTF